MTEEDKHFSDSMLQWMAEGDRLHEDPKHHGFQAEGTPRRSLKLWAAAGWAIALVFAGRFAVQHLGSGNAPVAAEAPAPVVAPPAPVAPAPVAAAAVVVPASVPPAPVSAMTVAPVVVAPAPAAVAVEPKPVEAKPVAQKPAAAPASASEKPIAAVQDEPPAKTVATAPIAPPSAASPAVAESVPAVAPAAAAVPVVDDFDALLGRCRDATARGRWGAARTACTAAQQVHPDSPDVLTRLAEIALNRGQGRAALRLASAALAADPAFADAYVIVGSVQQGENRNAEARAAYSQYLKLAPSGRYASDLRAILATL